jgi:hypothetical protein
MPTPFQQLSPRVQPLLLVTVWSLSAPSRVLFDLLIHAFCEQEAQIVVALDETLERRRGPKIRLADQYHDAARSTGSVGRGSRGGVVAVSDGAELNLPAGGIWSAALVIWHIRCCWQKTNGRPIRGRTQTGAR